MLSAFTHTHSLSLSLSLSLSPQEISFRHFGDTASSLRGGSMGGSIPKSTWKEFENVQKHFLTKFLQV